jgi:hypothetical protein
MIVGGGRAIWDQGKLGPISDATSQLDGVMAIDAPLGGGFVFLGDAGIFWSGTFDGPLQKLSGAEAAFSGRVAPHAVLCGTVLVGTDGKPIRGAPENVTELYANRRRGFAIAVTSTGVASLSSDGAHWRVLKLGHVSSAYEESDTLTVLQDSKALRVSADGKVTPVTLTDEERLALQLVSIMRPVTDDPFEGVFIEGLWQPTGRAADEWFKVLASRDIVVTHAGSGVAQKIGTASDDGCYAVTYERPLVVCIDVGKRLRVFHVDVGTGALELEKDVVVKSGVAARIGDAPGTFPTTLFITATCSGDGAHGYCVRDEQGGWRDLPASTATSGMLLPFPGEVLSLTDAGGGWELRSPVSLVRTVSADDVARMNKEVGAAASTGVLRTANGIDMLYAPDPMKPVTDAVSFALHVPFDPRAQPSVSRVSGVVATAGLHGLRLDGAKLFETDDGGSSFYEVPLPPGGLRDLGGAMCWNAGCVVGPWARVGWH